MTPQSAIVQMLILDAVILIPLYMFHRSKRNKRMATLFLIWFTFQLPLLIWFKANRMQWAYDLLLFSTFIPLLAIPLFAGRPR